MQLGGLTRFRLPSPVSRQASPYYITARINGTPTTNTFAGLVAATPSGGTLLFPAGMFHGTASVNVPMTISGAGKGQTIISGVGISPTGSKACLVATVTGVTVSNMTIQDFAIANGLGGNACAVRGQAGVGATLTNLEVTRCQDGILTDAGSGTWTISGTDFHDNGNGNVGGAATHEQYFGASPSQTVTETNVTSTCGPLATHAFKSRAGFMTLTNSTYTGNSTDPTFGGNAGAVIDVPECGAFSASNCTFNMPAGSSNPQWINYGVDSTANSASGMTASFQNCVFNSGVVGVGGVFQAFQAGCTLNVTGSVYTSATAPTLTGWATVIGTLSPAAANSATLSGSATVVVSASRRLSGSATLAGVATMAAATNPAGNSANMSGIGTMTVNATVVSGSAYVGPGDLQTFVQWGGLRAYSAAVAAAGTQPMIRLVRASDGHDVDVLVANTGGLGLTANGTFGGDNGLTVAAFLASTTGFVQEIYDQTGNGSYISDLGALPSSVWPGFVLSDAAGLPAIQFDGSTQYLRINNLGALTQPYAWSVVAERTGNFSSSGTIVRNDNTGSVMVLFYPAADTVGFYSGSMVTAAATDSAYHAINVTFNGASGITNIDGTAASSLDTSTDGSGSGNNFGFGATGGGTENLTGKIREFGQVSGSLNAAALDAMTSNQRAYWSF